LSNLPHSIDILQRHEFATNPRCRCSAIVEVVEETRLAGVMIIIIALMRGPGTRKIDDTNAIVGWDDVPNVGKVSVKDTFGM